MDGWTEFNSMQTALRDALEGVRRDEFNYDVEEGADGERAFGGGPLDQLSRVVLHVHVNGRNLWREFATSETPNHWEIFDDGGSVIDSFHHRVVKVPRGDAELNYRGGDGERAENLYRDDDDGMRGRFDGRGEFDEGLERVGDDDMDLDTVEVDEEDHEAFAETVYEQARRAGDQEFFQAFEKSPF
jgi:hypothetical protein